MEISAIKEGGGPTLNEKCQFKFSYIFEPLFKSYCAQKNMFIEIPIYYCFCLQIHPDNDFSGRVPSVGRV